MNTTHPSYLVADDLNAAHPTPAGMVWIAEKIDVVHPDTGVMFFRQIGRVTEWSAAVALLAGATSALYAQGMWSIYSGSDVIGRILLGDAVQQPLSDFGEFLALGNAAYAAKVSLEVMLKL